MSDSACTRELSRLSWTSANGVIGHAFNIVRRALHKYVSESCTNEREEPCTSISKNVIEYCWSAVHLMMLEQRLKRLLRDVVQVLVLLILLRSEIPSGMCAKLRTVAASNNRDHARDLSYYCLLALHIWWCYFPAHPVRGESHNQRNTTGEVATILCFPFVCVGETSRVRKR